MKFITVAVFLFVAFTFVYGDSSEEVLEHVKSKHLKKYLSGNKERLDEGLEKLEAQCPGVTPKLKAALKSFKECDDKADDSLTICSAIQKYTLNCTKPLLKVVDDCLPTKAKGLPDLGVKSLVSAAEYLCKQTGESIFELANPCLWEDDEESAEDDECEKKVKNFAAKYEKSHTIPDQTEICTALTDFRGCIVTHSGTSCKNQKTKDVIIGLYDALIKPCSHLNEA